MVDDAMRQRAEDCLALLEAAEGRLDRVRSLLGPMPIFPGVSFQENRRARNWNGRDDPPAAKPVQPLDPSRIDQATILLVSCASDLHQRYGRYLRRQGFAIDHASDQSDALMKVTTRRPHVIVAPTQLKTMSGFRLCLLLRRHEQTRDIVIILIGTDAHDATNGLHTIRADAALLPASTPGVLVSVIRRLLSQTDRAGSDARSMETRISRQIERSNAVLSRVRV